MPSNDDVSRQDVEALLEARRELGPSYDAALVDSFAERIERTVEERLADRQHERRLDKDGDQRQFVLGIVSLGTGIPITAISAALGDVPGLIVAWTGIVGVNVAHALRDRRRR